MVYLRTSFLIGFFFLCSFGWSKVWTTNTGSKSEGELFEVLADRIGLLIKGREYHFSLARFIQADQDYVRRWKMTPRCPSCSKPLGTRTIEAGGVKYHTSCFRCMVCRSGFRGGDQFRRDAWNGMVHVKHFQATGLCGTCSRIFVKRGAHPKQFFADGRMSCVSCLKDGVFETKILNEVEDRVWNTLTRIGISKPKGKLSIRLVDRGLLNKEALKINARGNLRGLTLTKYKIVKGGSNPGTTFEHRIYVLYGLPYIECESVLAHEFAHVWLNEKFIESTPPVIEGFCNLVSSEVLEKEKSKLASILLDNLQNNTSLAYGVGYRKMKANLAQKNWSQLLAEMKSKSKPPKLK